MTKVGGPTIDVEEAEDGLTLVISLDYISMYIILHLKLFIFET